MNRFVVSVQIEFYSEPYEWWTVWARDKYEALSKVDSMLPKHAGNRFLNAVQQ